MRLAIVRHAVTQGNLERRYVGRGTDEPLAPLGREQCAHASWLPEADLVYVSPMLRACQTARACYPCARIVGVAGLEEYDFGVFEGRCADEMVDDAAYRAWVDSGCVACCPGGESRAEYVARTNGALVRLLREAAARGEGRLVVVAHGGTIMAAFHAFAQGACGHDDYFDWHVGPCEGYDATVRLTGEGVAFEDVVRVGRACPLWGNPKEDMRGV